MQVALYGELQVQDRVAEHGALMLGPVMPSRRYAIERFASARSDTTSGARRGG